MISGADEPSAISERFATVGFHTISSIVPIGLPSLSLTSLIRVWDVITSMALKDKDKNERNERENKLSCLLHEDV